MGDPMRGLYLKFRVERTDGKSARGKKHFGCRYFALDLDCDPHAIPALAAYAESCRADLPLLAADLDVELDRIRKAAGLPPKPVEPGDLS